MAYDRWTMTPAKASTLTGRTITDAELEAAELDLSEVIGWAPDPDAYPTDVDSLGRADDARVAAMGSAVAWQAAHRQDAGGTPDPDGQPVALTDESIGGGDYSRSFAEGRGPVEGGPVAARARTLLARGGWLARRSAGTTSP